MPDCLQSETFFEFPFPVPDVWAILSKTDWINRSVGLPPVKYQVRSRTEGGTTVLAQARVMGQRLRWLEMPFEWVENEFYTVSRYFENGLFTEAHGGMSFEPLSGGGTRVCVDARFLPRHRAGAWIGQSMVLPKINRDMAASIRHARAFLEGMKPVPLPKLAVAPVTEEALQAGLARLRADGQPASLLGHLERLLREAPDVEVFRLRPLALARRWNQDRWDVVRFFLHATRCGLLDLSWEVLCPNCRSSRQPLTRSLAELEKSMHCEACQIKFDGEFDKSVELKFAVNPSVRTSPMQTFCLAGPGGKPHIVAQMTLPPGAEKTWRFPQGSAGHQLRSPQVKQTLALDANSTDQLGSARLVCAPEAFQISAREDSTPSRVLRLFNPNPFPVLVALERKAWDDDILTAAEATNWQEFRDLFSREVISPSQQITVGQQIVLFTDLRGSTAMYCDIGDAPAYSLVREHFAILQEVIRNRHGSIVKTIGDAVMAVFTQLPEAFLAVEEMHRELRRAASPSKESPELLLKSSLHAGPCLAVNANDQLDYFGTTINLAARLVDRCQGGDLTLSDEVFHRPEAAAFLRRQASPPEGFEVQFRGFKEPHKVWRVRLTVEPT